MTADLLRRAAEKLRGHANRARGDKPWFADAEWVRWGPDDDGRYIAEVFGLADKWPNAEYIALMHPPVALALAVAMEKIAWLVHFDDDLIHRVGYGEMLGVARAILREEGP